MTTFTATHAHLIAPAKTTRRSWKAIVRRTFELMGAQYSRSPNML